MARNDIVFGQAKQADFSQPNRMYEISQNLLQEALKSGKNSIDNFNKAVISNNDAKIKEFINSFSKEELMDNKDTISEFIADISAKSGGMYSKPDMVDYQDNRMSELISRDNQAMLNQEKSWEHRDKQLDVEADKSMSVLYNTLSKTNPDDVHTVLKEFNDSLVQNETEPELLGRIQQKLPKFMSDYIDSGSKQEASWQDYINTMADGSIGNIDSYVTGALNLDNEFTYLNELLQAGQISQEDYTKRSQELLNGYQALEANYLNTASDSKLINNAVRLKTKNLLEAKRKERDEAKANQAKQAFNQTIKERELKQKDRQLDIQETIADFNNAYTDAKTTQVDAQTHGWGTYGATSSSGGGTNGSGGDMIKGVVEKGHPSYDMLAKFGLTDINLFDGKALQNKYATLMTSVRNTELAKDNGSFAEWEQSDEAIALRKQIPNLLFENNWEEIKSTFPKDATLGEKKYVISQYAVNNGYVFGRNINKTNTNNAINEYRKQRDVGILTKQNEVFAELLQAVSSIYPELTPDRFLSLLLSDKRLPVDIVGTIPKEQLTGYFNNNIEQRKHYQSKASEFNKTVKKASSNAKSSTPTQTKPVKDIKEIPNNSSLFWLNLN